MDTVIVEGRDAPKRLVILMHGVGANAHDLEPIGRQIVGALPDTRVVLPNAPTPFEHGGPGFQWFSLEGITPILRNERVASALPSVVAWLDAERVKLHLTCEQLVIGGFSQGAIMALAAAADGFPCGKLLAFSGRLVDKVRHANESSPAIFIGHGELDQVIPVAEGRSAHQRLEASGYETTLRTYPRLAHGIANDELASAIAFLSDRSF